MKGQGTHRQATLQARRDLRGMGSLKPAASVLSEEPVQWSRLGPYRNHFPLSISSKQANESVPVYLFIW